jgi:hypothetical protein
MTAVAADRPVSVVPLVGFRGGATLEADVPGTPGSEADPAASLGIEVDVATRPDAWIEIAADRQELEFSPDGSGSAPFDLTIDYLQVGGRYQPGKDRFRPYVAVTVGVTSYGADGGRIDDSIGFSGSVGGGFDVSLGERVSFRGDLRGYATVGDATLSGICGAGCSIRLTADGWYQMAARIGLVFRVN